MQVSVGSTFKTRLKTEFLIGTLLTLSCPSVAEILSQIVDWLWFDLEHSSISLETAQAMLQAVNNRCPCLIRAPWNDSVWIKRILDTGCDGIIIPQIKTSEEVEAVIQACKYPPEGIRSVGISRAHNYGMNFQEYIEKANNALTIVIQIEHIEAVENIESIVNIIGFDAVMIGSYDLSASMGLTGDLEHPKVKQAISTIKLACDRKNIPCGIFVTDEQKAILAKENGFKLICLGIDVLHLTKAVKTVYTNVKNN